ncbi:TetR/AcrR family transcriptional regulator [Amycolatopsis anabasis]|uniref:TetR/AcrR family transcriptional regulator n=1 Tax=Amycolatopsis anabasis TaxID=1840409 RepID=UPI001FE5ADE0|nr:TetR/AcrR family transcriptional regulator [Amycolatopsis anabasis]
MTAKENGLLDSVLAQAEERPQDPGITAIMDGALSAFLDFGIRRTTMNEIARRAGLGVATVYRRFPQKGELVEAVMLREAARFVAGVDAKTRDARDLEELAVEGFVAFISGLRGHPLLTRLIEIEPETVLPMLTSGGAPLLALGRGYLAGVLADWQRRGELADFDLEPLAEVFARLAHSLALTPEGIIPSADDAATREFARTFLLPMLTAPR